jgi:DNA-binding transcriptional MerR regulator
MAELAIPNKLFFRIGEVCKLLSLEAYVLRFWEKEFPMLSPTKGANGRRMYRKKDVEMVVAIKNLLYIQNLLSREPRKSLEPAAPGILLLSSTEARCHGNRQQDYRAEFGCTLLQS